MHTLFFDSHTAVLDPVTGIGVLVLPDPRDESTYLIPYDRNESSQSAAERWFGVDTDEYLLILRQLSSIGWELPQGEAGALGWVDAGCTDCCGKSMIRLMGLDPLNTCPNQQQIDEAFTQIADFAVWTCCGVSLLVEALIS